jgi:hypothetical protein
VREKEALQTLCKPFIESASKLHLITRQTHEEISANYEVLTSPRLCARETACARLSTLSLLNMCFMCVLTVSGAMDRDRAISLFERPLAIKVRISLSRILSCSAIGDVETGLGSVE